VVLLAVASGVGLKVRALAPAAGAAIHRSPAHAGRGKALRQLDSARLAATLSILVGSRVPILGRWKPARA